MGRATAATLRRRLFTIPGRLVHTARRLHLRLPTNWPWASAFLRRPERHQRPPDPQLSTNALSAHDPRRTSEKPPDRQHNHAHPGISNPISQPYRSSPGSTVHPGLAGTKAWSRIGPAEHGDLVPQHEELDVLGRGRAAHQ